MAKRRGRRPKLFENSKSINNAMDNVKKSLIQGTLNAGVDAMNQTPAKGKEKLEVKRMPKYLQVTEKRLNKIGVIDLKPYFARSPHKKEKKDGGWYLVVPIQRKKKNMSKRMYTQLRLNDIRPKTQQTIISDYLYDRRQVSEASMLNYKPKSNNITKQALGPRKHAYIAYRTVSDTSPANSWILGRNKVNKDDESKTFVSNVNRLMKWKMKNG